MNMEELISKCDSVVSKWQERAATLETVKDFAAVFDMEIGWWIRPMAPSQTEEKPNQTSEPVPQYELFNELTVEDKYAMKSWRENNGLAWR